MALTVGKTAATVGDARALGLGALTQRRPKILTPIHKDIANVMKRTEPLIATMGGSGTKRGR